MGGNPAYGGMGMPKVLAAQFDEMACSASLAFILYPSLYRFLPRLISKSDTD
ncbi:hypothetical protein [Endozoicomonas ascidiicola]|uniref:hypothetical protein n=1 Tax=Endozoicomonas ascidiicola TaxID=1698521 RepID=UPI000A91CDE6|nr:hypothetical protein [Endozoicomonas ascidiicola]